MFGPLIDEMLDRVVVLNDKDEWPKYDPERPSWWRRKRRVPLQTFPDKRTQALNFEMTCYRAAGMSEEDAYVRAKYEQDAGEAGGDAAYSRQLDERIATLRQRGAR